VLAHDLEGLGKLSGVIEQEGLVSLVGCNMRFHPGPMKVKELLSRDQLGRLLFARLHTGSYLPDWRPGTDYRDNYASREETGGGCILDCIHELDLGRWYLGDVCEVVCVAGHLSSLEISTEDVAVVICRHTSGAISEIHLDYVQRTYERGCQVVGESGTVFWDFNQGIRWYEASDKRWNQYEQRHTWESNEMYLDELRHFVDCVQHRRQTTLPVGEAIEVMKIAVGAKRSARSRSAVRMEDVRV